MAIPLEQAVDIAVSGKHPDEDTQSVKLGKHNFFIRGLVPHELIQKGETGFFRHQHAGKDDRIFYSIKILDKDKKTYTATITRIQFRGPLNSGTRKFGDDVAGFLEATGDASARIVAKIARFLKVANLQSKLEGDWVTQAAKIVDAIGKRMANGK